MSRRPTMVMWLEVGPAAAVRDTARRLLRVHPPRLRQMALREGFDVPAIN